MPVNPLIPPKFRAFDADGDPLAGGLLYTYAAGTTTPQATYTTRAGSVANANPVVLDANGEANVWMTPGVDYKFELRNSAGVVQWTVDNVPSPTGVDTLTDGNVNSPGLAFANDTDTGIYRPATNTLAISAGATKVAEATQTGVAFPVGATATASGAGAGFTGTATTTANSVGVQGTATTRTGVKGSATSGTGVYGEATTGKGVIGASTSNVGVDGVSDSSIGVRGGTVSGHGVYGEATGGGFAGGFVGNLKLYGANPAATTEFINTITPTSTVKAWGLVSTDGAGGVTLHAGFNVIAPSPFMTSPSITIGFGTPMTSSSYSVIVSPQFAPADAVALFDVGSRIVDASNFEIHADASLATNARRFSFVVFGAM